MATAVDNRIMAQKLADKKYRQEAKRRKTQALMNEMLAHLPEGFEYKPDLSAGEVPDQEMVPECYHQDFQAVNFDSAENEHSGEDSLIYTG